MASALSSSSASAPSQLQCLPSVLQQQVATHLPIRDMYELSKVCRSLCQSIRATPALEIAYVRRDLTAYRSPASDFQFEGEDPMPACGIMDRKISELESRLRQMQQPQAAAAAPHNPEEEIAIEKVLNRLRVSRLPNDQIPQNVIDIVTGYLERPERTIRFPHPELPLNGIDTKQWNTFVGEVANSPMPCEVAAFLRQPCTLFAGKTKSEGHLWIDVPPIVGGSPLTLRRLLNIAEHNNGNKIHVDIYLERILQVFGGTPIPACSYILLKTCLPDTKSRRHTAQLEVLEKHPEYMEASLMQVLVASLMEYIRSGVSKTRLFEDEYARTSTMIPMTPGTLADMRLCFGGFGSKWPRVCCYPDVIVWPDIGLAVVLRPGESAPVTLRNANSMQGSNYFF